MMFLANSEGLKSASEIAQYKNISKGLIARSVDSLSEKGYLTADRDKNDRRLVRLQLTEKSGEIVERIRRCRKDFVEELHKDIPEEDLEILHRTASIMNQNVESFLYKSSVKTDDLPG
jgi:DNA-binding MarR family transcriptional regulator